MRAWVWVSELACICMRNYVCVSVYACMYVHVHAFMRVFVCMCVCACVCVCAQTNAHRFVYVRLVNLPLFHRIFLFY